MQEIFTGKKESNRLNLGQGVAQVKNKSIIIIFVLLIITFLGVRIWAEKNKSEVPCPFFISASDKGVAVAWRNTIYLLDHEGNVTGKESFPKNIILTQVMLTDDELWIADRKSGSVYKLKDNTLTKIINAPDLIRGIFKFVFSKNKDKIYLTDSSNHKVHIFDKNGKYEKSFGREGKEPGELKFPNSIVLTKYGNFLIVNTNAHRLDIYSSGGDFVKTFAAVKAIGDKFNLKKRGAIRELLADGEAALSRYEWPSLLTQSGDKVIFLLAKNGFDKAKVIVYNGEGQFVGELVPPESLNKAGDVTSWGNNVFVTDRETRKIYLFNVDNMSYVGEFSKELEKLGSEEAQKEKEYRLISRVSLAALLLLAVPVFFLLIRQRRQEAKEIDAVDIKPLVPAEAIWAVETDKKKMIISVALMVLMPIISMILAILTLNNTIIQLITLLLLTIGIHIAFQFAFKLMKESGYLTTARRPVIEKILKVVSLKLKEIIKPNENILGCTVLQSSFLFGKFTLFVLTNRQLLLFDVVGSIYRFTHTDFSHYGYGNVKSVTVEKVTKPSRFFAKSAKLNINKLSLSIDDGTRVKELTFFLAQDQILEKIKTFLEENRLKGEFIDLRIEQQEKTFKALHPGWRGKTISPKVIAPVLSAIFPGLGQFYNRQILKGTGFFAAFLIFIFILIYPIRTMIEKSAEYDSKDILAVISMIIALLIFYGINIADAYYNGKKDKL